MIWDVKELFIYDKILLNSLNKNIKEEKEF